NALEARSVCAPAGTHCRSTPLRQRASRPQLERDPLGRLRETPGTRPYATTNAHLRRYLSAPGRARPPRRARPYPAPPALKRCLRRHHATGRRDVHARLRWAHTPVRARTRLPLLWRHHRCAILHSADPKLSLFQSTRPVVPRPGYHRPDRLGAINLCGRSVATLAHRDLGATAGSLTSA